MPARLDVLHRNGEDDALIIGCVRVRVSFSLLMMRHLLVNLRGSSDIRAARRLDRIEDKWRGARVPPALGEQQPPAGAASRADWIQAGPSPQKQAFPGALHAAADAPALSFPRPHP